MATAKKHPTNAQFDEVKSNLSGRYGANYFLIDGYLISASIERSGNKLCIAVYVDGWIKGSHLWRGKEAELNQMPDIARKFLCLSKMGNKTGLIKSWEKMLGKSRCKKEQGWLYEKHCYVTHFFSTAGVFIAHIKKHNDSIELLTYEAYSEALALLPKGDSDEQAA